MSCTGPRLDPLRSFEFITVPYQYLEVGGFEGWDGERAGWPGSGGASCGGTMRGGDGEASWAGRRAWGGAGGSRGPTLRSYSSGTRGFPTCWVGRRILKQNVLKMFDLAKMNITPGLSILVKYHNFQGITSKSQYRIQMSRKQSKPKLVGSDYLATTHDQRTSAEQESVSPISWNSELKSKLEIHAAQSGAVSSRRRTKSDPLTERRTSDPRSSLARRLLVAAATRQMADGTRHDATLPGKRNLFLTERDKNQGKSVASSHNELLTLNEIWWSFKNTSTLWKW